LLDAAWPVFSWKSALGDGPAIAEFLRLAAPTAFMMAVEFGTLQGLALIAGALSPATLAAHTALIATAFMLAMFPLAIGVAAGVRVGHAIGKPLYYYL
jgi:MATE family multidrug resistance protein